MAPSSATAASTARPHPRRCLSSRRSRLAPASSRQPHTRAAATSFTATSSPRSPPPTKMATGAWPVRLSAASCAARCGQPRWSSRTSAPRSAPHPSIRRSAAPNRRSPCRHPWPRRPSRSTTTPPPSTGAPTRGARPPSAPSRASSTQPPSTSQEAGAASWASHPARSFSRAPSSLPTPTWRTPPRRAKPRTTGDANAGSRRGAADGAGAPFTTRLRRPPTHRRDRTATARSPTRNATIEGQRSQRRDRRAPPSAHPAIMPWPTFTPKTPK